MSSRVRSSCFVKGLGKTGGQASIGERGLSVTTTEVVRTDGLFVPVPVFVVAEKTTGEREMEALVMEFKIQWDRMNQSGFNWFKRTCCGSLRYCRCDSHFRYTWFTSSHFALIERSEADSNTYSNPDDTADDGSDDESSWSHARRIKCLQRESRELVSWWKLKWLWGLPKKYGQH